MTDSNFTLASDGAFQFVADFGSDGFAAAEGASIAAETAPAAQGGADSAPAPAALVGFGAISLAAIGTAVTENFDTLANTGTAAILPSGWFFDEVGSAANLAYAAGTGSSTTGDTYSFGAAASTERAFGTLLSSNNAPTLGAQFTNNTGSAIGTLDIAYVGEQWRLGTLARADGLVFQISFDATDLSTGTWTTVSQLNFTAPVTTGTVGARDGNLAANRTAISYSLVLAAAVASGQSFWIRWTDTNASGSDDGLGIDNFSITPRAAVPVPGALAINDVALAEGNAGATDLTFTVTRSGGTSGAVTADWALNFGTADAADLITTTLTGTVSFADGESSRTITIQVAGDTTFEASETFTIDLSNATGGATISDASGTGTITNDDVAPAGTLAINDVAVAEGDSGTTNMVFTVTRSAGSAGAVSATWTVANGTTNAADFSGALTGTVSFADGETSATVTVAVAGDTTFEPNEAFTVNLTAPIGGATIGDAAGAGTITNDDAAPAVANVWINEFNYDPVGADANEFIELAGLAGTDLTGWTLVLYNGTGGASYSTLSLSGALTDTSNGFGFVKVLTPGLQNGAPDGFALVDNLGRVVQFLSYEGSMIATSGAANGMTSTDVGVEQANAALGFTLQLTGAGSSYAGFTWAANVANTEGAVNAGQTFLSGTDQGVISIRDAAVTEGNAGTANLTFTVSRAGGFASAATVDYAVLLTGTANAADLDAAAVLSGTLTFAANEFTRTITVPVTGDTTGEDNETLSVQLSNVTGNAVIGDGVAIGTITNDDPVPLTIMQIQGAGHQSAYVGQPVTTTGIVTAVDTTGYFLQDAAGDANANTSDAVFVFTGTAPAVAVGDAVSVSGSVAEFVSGAGLSVTQLNQTAVTVTSAGNALPTAVLIGTGGLLPPTGLIDNDGLTSFDPATDGIDFWETLEGMRVTIDAPQVVSNTNSFGETDVVASLGLGATGVNARGGITISGPADYNPEKIQLDDRFGALIGYTPAHTIGDQLASVTGVLNYSFLNYEVLVTAAVTVTSDTTLAEERTALIGDANYLTIATYNLENMDPSDNKYTILANDIVYSLRAPDILAVQEVQDADGAGGGSNLSGVSNVQGLIDAIFAQSGLVYTYVEIAPDTANTTGGEPGGNIRNGYLYQADRVTLVSGSLALLTDAAFTGSRKPLVATWLFQGEEVTTINVHFTSRGGSDPLWGATQPPGNAGDGARTSQAAAVGAYINANLATDPALNYMILGDWNGFYFETAQTQLTDGGVLTNLSTLLSSEERYSYVFEGNSQLIDNLLVTGGLFTGAEYDAVHLNAEFAAAGRPTDHDPQIARLLLGPAPSAVALSANTVAENQVANTAVGTVSAVDTAGDTLIYSLSDNAGGRFIINSATGAVTTTGSLNFEAAASHSITAVVTDGAGQATSRAFTINVGNVNEAPVAVADGVAVDEDATSANLWSTLLGNDSDPDAGAVLTIVSVDTTGTLGSVIFNAGTQTLQYVADDTSFDALTAGATAPDTFTYTISDGTSQRTATVTMTVTGIADIVPTPTPTAGNDTFTGTDGEDELLGGAGVDTLSGGKGHDWLEGGIGNDFLTGGEGYDTYVFSQGDKHDFITDFSKFDDRLLIGGGGTVGKATVFDFNNDGILDLRIKLFWNGVLGGSATLLGIDSLEGVRIDFENPLVPPSTTGQWVDWTTQLPPASSEVLHWL